MEVPLERLTSPPDGCYGGRLMADYVGVTDGDLARAVAETAGQAEEAESELYRRFASRVRFYGLRHLRDEDAALDLAQQVMLLTIEKLRSGAIRDADQIGSFILGASRTMTIDLKRRERRRERLRDVFVVEPLASAPHDDTSLDLDRLGACLGQLPERERLVMLLTFYAERSARQVGDELTITEGNVRVIRHRAIGRLRACMTGTGGVQ